MSVNWQLKAAPTVCGEKRQSVSKKLSFEHKKHLFFYEGKQDSGLRAINSKFKKVNTSVNFKKVCSVKISEFN